MAMHVHLLMDRLGRENNALGKTEMQAFIFYCKTIHFVEFGQIIHPYIPVEDFSNHYIENYFNRIRQFEQTF
jgi:hypothetical protein